MVYRFEQRSGRIMEGWIDLSILDQVIGLVDADLWHIVGWNPSYVQFSLVFIFMMSLMWVIRPIIEWLIVKQWALTLSYSATALLVFSFLQLVDRYAMVQNESSLPSQFWPICLLAISGYGAIHLLFVASIKVWQRMTKRTRRRAA
ncbi:hypothetical protein [Halobacillus salinus]|uniref:hypothetical protein n=1 Tax=Halobacillus salinus TaxID=192814 RepID=UPI00158FB43B|nr:hypothetical protein [Halobacillus salinus]